MRDLSVVTPARNEILLARTIEDVLANMRADTEIIAVCDGSWPDPPLRDHPRVQVIHFTESIGQRAATNAGARLSQAKYVMKLDAHCRVDEGFDAKLIQDCQPDWTMVPAMHHLHAFDWRCRTCGNQTYQGFRPSECKKCQATDFEMVFVWKPRHNRPHISYRFDKMMHFQYWKSHRKRPECQGPIVETMSFIGACMLLERERFWALGGMDEAHGSWGQFGTEWACKTWLSGGKLVTSRKTWFAHLFRTGNFHRAGESSFPYPLSEAEQERSKAYSRDLWLNDRWPLAKHSLAWLVDRFKPVPDWHEGAK